VPTDSNAEPLSAAAAVPLTAGQAAKLVRNAMDFDDDLGTSWEPAGPNPAFSFINESWMDDLLPAIDLSAAHAIDAQSRAALVLPRRQGWYCPID